MRRLQGIIVLVLAGFAAVARGQSFEVASIKPQPWTNEGAVEVYVRGNTLYGEHVDLYRLVEFAYGLRPDDYQLSGGPAWGHRGVLADSTLFQVTAKAPEGSTPSLAQFRLMLQALLADRFRLQVHHAQKELPVFDLVVGRGGLKMRANSSDVKDSLALNDGRLFRMRAIHIRIRELVEQLADPAHGAGRLVIDKTGLLGFYDFEIEWTPEAGGTRLKSDGVETQPLTANSSLTSVYSAVQGLGLKLEPAVAEFDTVVIDHAEKPSAN